MPRVLTGAMVLALLLAAPAAAEPVGPELTVAQEDVRTAAVSVATPERGLVTWSQRGGYAARIMGRDAEADGVFDPILGSFPPADAGQVVGAAANPDRREHLLAWPQDGELRVRRLAALGGPVGPAAVVLAPLPAGRPAAPDGISVTYSEGRKEYLVVWSEPAAGGASAIRARRVSELGAVLGAGPVTLSDDAARPRNLAPHGAPRPDGWHVAWNGIRADGRSEILAEALEGDGSERGTERVIGTGTSPALAADPTGDAVAAWADGGFVVSRRLNRSSEATGDTVRLASSASTPAIAWSALGRRYLAVWRGASERVRGRLLDPEGRPVGEQEEEISVTESATREPAVGAQPASGDFLVAWGTPARGFARWVQSATTSTDGDAYDPYSPADPYASYEGYGPSSYGDHPYEPPPFSDYPEDERRDEESPEGAGASLRLVGTPTLRRLAGTGLTARVTCPGRCVASLRITVSPATARRYRLPATLAHVTRRTTGSGTVSGTLRPRLVVRRKLRGLERLRVTATLDATLADGGTHERRRQGVTLAR